MTDETTDPTAKTLAKEELFVSSVLAHGNATQAAKDAGYAEATAHAKGHELLQRPRVKAALDKARRELATKFKVKAQNIVQEMALIAFSSIQNYRFDEDGYVVVVDDAPDGAIRAVKKIKRKLRLIPQKPIGDLSVAPIREVETEVELWNKDTELRALGEHLKMFKENRDEDDDHDLTPAQRRERVLGLIRVAANRKKAAGGKKAG